MWGGEGEEERTQSLDAVTAWLWSKPLGSHSAELDEDECADVLQEEAELECGARARHLYSQRTVSREVPPDQSRSGRLYQRVQRSALEFSGPTMSIKSQWSNWSSSPKPLPPPQAPSLTSWTPTASLVRYSPPSINSESPRTVPRRGRLGSSTGRSGTTQQRTNSGSFTKATGPLRLRDHSESP
ncbi:putative movement protein P4 [Ixeridium yellow mottle virus 1]|uniref:putative movement protein P4 n=1 Tax=Ixeridium yellow mottle virus 1 TaxID=1809767 RepID=UPI0007830D63|nr:putative movement protein P4 [Ixeridium yellow mottle virus 1]AMQ22792.1 putative movement protein P4 [Ixeridium yellow mottle virus 1]